MLMKLTPGSENRESERDKEKEGIYERKKRVGENNIKSSHSK